jgi:hypothetical protein
MRVQKPTTRQPGYNTGITGGISGINNQVPPPATGQVSPDALVTGGPAAQVGNLGQQQAQHGIGRGGSGTKGPGTKPNTQLSADQLKLIASASIDSAGLKGRGRLTGEIEKVGGKFMLITALEGSKSQVSFALDLPQKDLARLEGSRVAIEGMIEKKIAWGGKITGAKFSANAPSVRVGSHQVLAGKIDNRSIMAIGGEAPPSGSYLVLDKPIKVGGKTVKEVFIEGAERKQGSSARLHGRIDEGSFGGVETPKSGYVALSGVTNEKAGEPRYVKGNFVTARGAELQRLSYNRPLMYDAPARIFVLDGDKAFLGGLGGFLPPERNPFHGFSGSAKLTEATAAERKAIKFNAEGTPIGKDGEAMVRIDEELEAEAALQQQMSFRWFFDAAANTAFRFDTGGGLSNHLSAVITAGEG